MTTPKDTEGQPLKKLREWLEWSVIGVAIFGVIYCCFYVDFKLWRIEHPNAPTWIYWVRGKR